MTDPRAITMLPGVQEDFATFEYDTSIVYNATLAGGSVSIGLAVKLVSAATVGLATDGSNVEGVLVKVADDGFCTVQNLGFCTLPGGTGASLTVGKRIVGALLVAAPGYIREVATATAAELGLCAHTIVDASTPTAVVVELD